MPPTTLQLSWWESPSPCVNAGVVKRARKWRVEERAVVVSLMIKVLSVHCHKTYTVILVYWFLNLWWKMFLAVILVRTPLPLFATIYLECDWCWKVLCYVNNTGRCEGLWYETPCGTEQMNRLSSLWQSYIIVPDHTYFNIWIIDINFSWCYEIWQFLFLCWLLLR